MSILTAWVIIGILVNSWPWANKKRPFVEDLLMGLILIMIWPIVLFIRSNPR